jgi:hypothetical protein
MENACKVLLDFDGKVIRVKGEFTPCGNRRMNPAQSGDGPTDE